MVNVVSVPSAKVLDGGNIVICVVVAYELDLISRGPDQGEDHTWFLHKRLTGACKADFTSWVDLPYHRTSIYFDDDAVFPIPSATISTEYAEAFKVNLSEDRINSGHEILDID